MAQLTITNVSSEEVRIQDLYASVPPGGVVTTQRSVADLARMPSLQAALARNQITLSLEYSADEVASGLQAPPASVEASDMAPVMSTVVAAGMLTMRKAFTAGGDAEVPLYSAGTLPFKFRVLDAVFYVSAAVDSSTLEVNDEAGLAGNTVVTGSSGTTGRSAAVFPANATVVVTPAGTKGLFLNRSDAAVAGEVVIFGRVES